jgi:hypothetical protein
VGVSAVDDTDTARRQLLSAHLVLLL